MLRVMRLHAQTAVKVMKQNKLHYFVKAMHEMHTETVKVYVRYCNEHVMHKKMRSFWRMFRGVRVTNRNRCSYRHK